MPRLDLLFGPLPRDIGRHSTLDGFRALAILLLVVGHYGRAWPPLPGIFAWALPVDLSIVALFVLTGFLVTERLQAEWHRTQDIAIARYWVRKVVRFYPAFAVFVLFSSAHHLLVEVEVPLARVLSVLGLTGNYYYALAESDVHRHIIGHLWSVAVGAQFLAVWPIMLLAALRGGWVPWLVRGALALVAVAMTLRSVTRWFSEIPPIYPYNATEHRVDALLIGAVLSLGLQDERISAVVERLSAQRAFVAVTLGALMISLGSAGWYRSGPGYSVEALLLAALIVAAIRAERRGEWRWLRSAPLRFVSTISFSLFLWHLYPLTVDSWMPSVPFALRAPLTLLTTFAVGATAYLTLERPALVLVRRLFGGVAAATAKA